MADGWRHAEISETQRRTELFVIGQMLEASEAKLKQTRDQTVQTAKDAAEQVPSASKTSFAAFGNLLLDALFAAIGGLLAEAPSLDRLTRLPRIAEEARLDGFYADLDRR